MKIVDFVIVILFISLIFGLMLYFSFENENESCCYGYKYYVLRNVNAEGTCGHGDFFNYLKGYKGCRFDEINKTEIKGEGGK